MHEHKHMEEKISTLSFCWFCYASPTPSCNSNVASGRSYMEKLACFSEVFCKLCFLEQVMFCNTRKKEKKKEWKIICKLRHVPHFFIFSPNCYFLPPRTPKPIFCSFWVSNFTAITAAMPCLFWYMPISEYM